MSTPIKGIEDAQTLAQAIVDTIHEPLLVLDADLTVLAASRSFYQTFTVEPQATVGRLLYDLGDGQWNIPALRLLLETIIPEKVSMDGFEVEHDFPNLGHRIMALNARKVIYAKGVRATILLAFTDITARRAIELEKAELLHRTEELLEQKQVLLEEMRHRVANSLQIIASILTLKAKSVTSEETRHHLRDARERVMSVAQVQSHLNPAGRMDRIVVGPYLTTLCASLGASMIGEDQAIDLKVDADDAEVTSDKAVSIGLIVTELVINAIKYAFPPPRDDARILVCYHARAPDDWLLSVSDNGIGKLLDAAPVAGGGLGSFIIEALVKQLAGHMQMSGAPGMTVSISQSPKVSEALPKQRRHQTSGPS